LSTIGHAFGRKDLQRDDAIQLRLARLVNHAHAAAPQTFQDFQLREVRGQFRRGGRRGHRGGFVGENDLRFEVQRHDAARTQVAGGAFPQGSAALRAIFRGVYAHAR
jgi:hypothetical protein